MIHHTLARIDHFLKHYATRDRQADIAFFLNVIAECIANEQPCEGDLGELNQRRKKLEAYQRSEVGFPGSAAVML